VCYALAPVRKHPRSANLRFGDIRTLVFAAFLGISLAPAHQAAAKSPNLVLISIDTLRADHLPMYGYRSNTIPFIASRAVDGLVFSNATVPLPNTTPSHASMLTGLYPSHHGSTGLTVPMSRSADTLPAALQRSHYDTAGFVAVFHLGSKFNFDQGFATFGENAADVVERDGSQVNADAIRWIARHRQRNGDQPFFLFVHYFDCHAPYGWWRGQKNTAALPVTRQVELYDLSIRRVDALVRQLYESLKQNQLVDGTVFCVTADHGEQIGEHGLTGGHADIYSETTRVPLIFFGTGIPSSRVEEPVSELDIAPSLAALAGAHFAGPRDGRMILPKPGLLGRLLFVSAATRDFGGRQFLVTGNPWYTRSIEVVTDRYWFIKNVDYVYRDVRTGRWDSGHHDSITTLKKLAPIAEAEDSQRFAIPATNYGPFVTTLEFIPTQGSCSGQLTALIAPGIQYFTTTLRGEGVKLQFSAARLDEVVITIKPLSCRGTMSYGVDRPGDAPSFPATTQQTRLFAVLYAMRKLRGIDELYDTRSDPGMTRNLIADPAMRSTRDGLEQRAKEMYEDTYGRGFGQGSAMMRVPDEDIRKLRSLGYIF